MASCRKNKAENDKIENTIEKKEDMKAAKKSSTKAELTVSAAAGTVKKGAEQPAETKKAPAKKTAPVKAEAKPVPAPKKEEGKKAPAPKATVKPEPVPAAKAEAKKTPVKKAEPKAETAPAPKKEEAKKTPAPKAAVKPEPVPAPKKEEAKKAPVKKVEPKVEAAPAPKAEEKKAPAKKVESAKADVKPEIVPVQKAETPKAPAKKIEPKKAQAEKPAPKADDIIPQASGKADAQGEPNISSPPNVKTPAPAPKEIGSIDTAEGKLATHPEETPVEKQPPLGQIKDNPPKGKAVAAEVELVRQPGEVRYSDEDLAEFAEVITQQRVDALDELRMLKDRLDDLTSAEMAEESMIYSMHMAEQGSEAIEKEKTYAQIQRINEYIKKLDDALKRIKDKTYGVCRVCNILIAKERLMAVPITTLSASYKIHSRCPEDGIDRIEPIKVG